ncbi:VIT1/CCC1 transporter family protein [Humibacter sp. RRB41]|uniref:VIT1/CCC1 transporter family protein n=1 Tax=Humibacter sp. RRB41 TaxID=2919946 RepID=UPI001FAA4E88|nr:VIT1/CCC1 transporter family protein [Humibacter sp. RRB41]
MSAPAWVPDDSVSRADSVRDRIVDANDGIIATAGIIEGFVGAGAGDATVTVAAFVTMVAGGLALGVVTYSELATQRDAHLAIIENERRRLALTPEQEEAELAAIYEAKGLSPELAAQVAAELSAGDALASQVEAEYGFSLSDVQRPVLTGVSALGAFVLGSAAPLAAALLAPDAWRIPITLAAVVVSLVVTSVIVARYGRARLLRTITRTVVIGVLAVAVSLAGGRLFHI